MTDYLALAREALQHEGISTYFGNMVVVVDGEQL